jgi:hypothetical protein
MNAEALTAAGLLAIPCVVILLAIILGCIISERPKRGKHHE